MMTREELQEILVKHNNGERVDLKKADLKGMDLKWVNLRGVNLEGANLEGANLYAADLTEACLKEANLREVDFKWANLKKADLEKADIDYACMPLWCGSLAVYFDDRQIIQIMYHMVKAGLNSPNVSDELKDKLKLLIDTANRCHRVKECGYIKYE